ncbi:hypothetical protein C9994_08635 [Marivirga lumbricoides]|uniref:Uncharacterized protein n=1 Tax=Marivirga lumbricoides TaxID=1046115 RepID=A0A2T4DQS6_9BACT|nr:hypothetical protein C9994_08635 [Marivirga lumbricoides]
MLENQINFARESGREDKKAGSAWNCSVGASFCLVPIAIGILSFVYLSRIFIGKDKRLRIKFVLNKPRV